MPIGKDSIQKRVMQASGTALQEEKSPAPEGAKTVSTPEQADAPGTNSAPRRPGRPRKQPAATAEAGKATEAETTTGTAEAVAATETATATTTTTTTTTTVMGNVSPEVVEKVTGHPEGQGSRSVQVTEDMPYYLL